MIPFDFEYYKPSSVSETVELFRHLYAQGKNPIFYAGGTEIITWSRVNSIHPGAVIDLKSIPECNVMQFQNNHLVIGSCVTLSMLSAANLFPLLSVTAHGAADQTARNKITFGGNISGRIYYRESILPLLLSNSRVVIAGLRGFREASIHDVFLHQIKLDSGEFLVQMMIDREYVTLPYVHFKKRQIGNVGYPLVTIAALKKDHLVRTAYSGVCGFPFRSIEMEQVLNNPNLSLEVKVEQAIAKLPAPILTNTEGSAAYREFVLKHTLTETLNLLEGR